MKQSQIQKKGFQPIASTATSSLLQSRPFESQQPEVVQETPVQAQLQHAQQSGHSFTKMPVTAASLPIQAKLTIGKPNDKYEQEADQVAAQVVSRLCAPEPVASPKLHSKATLRRKPLNQVQRSQLPEEDELQMKPLSGVAGGDVSNEWEGELNRARGGGQPLLPTLREPMERSFGADFGGVRMHTGAQADGLARSIQAKAFTTGQDVFFRQGAYEPGSRGGQELIAHELTHVVQQNSGMMRQSPSIEFAATETSKNIRRRENCVDGESVIQRVVGDYLPGTLRSNYIVMKNLSLAEMNIVQQLHDDVTKHYTIDEARQVANSTSMFNPYAWEVTGISSYATTDAGVQSIFDNFGHPTQSVVKIYDDLASRVGFDVGKDRKGALSASTISDLHQHFEASKPLHLGFNPFLNSAWTGNLDDYNGSKTGIPLYSVMRSAITQNFEATLAGAVTLNELLKEVSGRPAELHHLLFKAHYPDLAANPFNLELTERSESEKRAGPGQHELMHMVASGNHSNKFNELLPQYKDEYQKWLKSNNTSLYS